jgi:hypothetical protein
VSHDPETRLFNPETGEHGQGFTRIMDPRKHDVIVVLPRVVVDYIHLNEIDLFATYMRQNMPSIPSETLRVWIYEDEPANAITFVVGYRNSWPVRAYQLIDPCTRETMIRRYDYPPPLFAAIAPDWLCRDYHNRVRRVESRGRDS